jgi:hypothetical protein
MYALGMADIIAWQCDWKSGSYVELIRHLQICKESRSKEVRGDDKFKIRERLLLRLTHGSIT